jgi:uncharacterized protein YhaN
MCVPALKSTYTRVRKTGATSRIDGVRYDELAPMLLNELQQQAAEIRDLKEQMAELKDLKQELHAALAKLQAEDALVAQR